MNKNKDTYSIYYSGSGTYNNGVIAPSVCCIAIYNVKTKEMHSFSLDKYICENKPLMEAEKLLLTDFTNFFNKIKNSFFVHWLMDSETFGFKAIFARCANFGINNLEIGKLDTFNIKPYYFGCTDITLLEALEDCECDKVAILDRKSEIRKFNSQNFGLVAQSAEAKAIGIAKLFKECTESPWCNGADEDSNIVKKIESMINTVLGIRLYKGLCDITTSQDTIYEIFKALKTDDDKRFLFNVVESGERNVRLLKFLALEYANDKYNIQAS